MKKILIFLTLAICSAATFATSIKIDDDFAKLKVGESCIPGWINQFIKNPDNGIGSAIASEDGKSVFFNIKADKIDTSFYRDEMTPAKSDDRLICEIRVKGKGKFAIGCYGYGANGRYFPLPGRQRIFTATENSKLFRATIYLSSKGRLPLGKIRPCFTVYKGSDITIQSLSFTYQPKPDAE